MAPGLVYVGAATLKLDNIPSMRKVNFYLLQAETSNNFYGQSCTLLSSESGQRPNLASTCRSAAPLWALYIHSFAQRSTSPALSSPSPVRPQVGHRLAPMPPAAARPLWLPRLGTTQALLRHLLTLVPPPLCHGLALMPISTILQLQSSGALPPWLHRLSMTSPASESSYPGSSSAVPLPSSCDSTATTVVRLKVWIFLPSLKQKLLIKNESLCWVRIVVMAGGCFQGGLGVQGCGNQLVHHRRKSNL